MAYGYRNVGRARTDALVLVSALALSGICLLLSSLIKPQAPLWRYLLVALGATITGFTLIWLGTQENGYWWILPCATSSLGVALSLGSKLIIPATSNLFMIGVVLASGGLGLSLSARNDRSPELIFAIDGLALFIAFMLLLSGISYAFNWISLAFIFISYGLAITALYFPMVILYVIAGVLAVMSILCAPSPESGLRLLLPVLLIISGLSLLWYSRPDGSLV
jgi:hypothetical protein